MEEKIIHLKDFVKHVLDNIAEWEAPLIKIFEENWEKDFKENPDEAWPMEMTFEEWDEQLSFWLEG
jgi:hypothetical protein